MAAYNIYWGDPHGHSGFSECYWKDTDFPSCKPEVYYRNARYSAGLDFATLTDHDLNLTQEDWNGIVTASNEANEPNAFVTVPGFEWTSAKYGHQNLYFIDDSGPLIKCRQSGRNIGPMDKTALWASSEPQDWMPPSKLWHLLEGMEGRVITVPHHVGVSQMPYDWNYHNPAFQPVTEITSLWGNFESPETDIDHGISDVLPDRYVRDALNRGYRLGFIGGGDSHDGHPGDTYFGPRRKRNVIEGLILGRSRVGRDIAEFISDKTANTRGLTAVLAERLTRDSVFRAVTERRCYATTGARIEIAFTVNGMPMGSEFTIGSDEKVELMVSVRGTASIKSVEVVRNNGFAGKWEPGSKTFRATINDVPGRGVTWYYLRVLQKDGHRAWSSPVWVTRPGFQCLFSREGDYIKVRNPSYSVAVPHKVLVYSAEPLTFNRLLTERGRRTFHDGYNLRIKRTAELEAVLEITGLSTEGKRLFSGSVDFHNAAQMRFRTFNFRTVKYGGDLYATKRQTVSWSFTSEGEPKGLSVLVRAKLLKTLSFRFRSDMHPDVWKAPLHFNGAKSDVELAGCVLIEYHGDALVMKKRVPSIPGFETTRIAKTRAKGQYILAYAEDAESEPLRWPGE
ncbi:MAG: CehA/McbA family metallohydrolase [Thermoplasmata archaeon]|nr:CehA/McbA family metallohydrolase [Candidatus Sysuiplasma acidicola]MBX8645572.1 CehA/McbA family metallohydrolase [Candidatus Sysuiplasma acidicola]